MKEKIKRIAFRVDADKEIGMGHFMRCRTIIQELRKRGIMCTLYSDSPIDKFLIDGIADYVKIEEMAFSNADADLLRQHMLERKEDIVFIDSYKVTEEYLKRLFPFKRILLVDSFCDLDVEILIQPNAYLEKDVLTEGMADVYLRGLKYQPIRDEFFENQMNLRTTIKSILILSGGTFPREFVNSLLMKIYGSYEEVAITVVLGNYAEKDDKEELLARYSDYKIIIYQNVTNMSKIMQANDVIISACGSAIYEIMACGVPVIAYSMAPNQKVVLEKLQSQAGILYAGDISEGKTLDNIVEFLRRLMTLETRQEQVQLMKKMIACNGAKNIVDEILKIN